MKYIKAKLSNASGVSLILVILAMTIMSILMIPLTRWWVNLNGKLNISEQRVAMQGIAMNQLGDLSQESYEDLIDYFTDGVDPNQGTATSLSEVMNRKIRDAVFTNLFSEEKYVMELQKALPSYNEALDKGLTEKNIRILTTENILVYAEFNDLSFYSGGNANSLLGMESFAEGSKLVMVEAQSTWDPNIATRLYLYHAQAIRKFHETCGFITTSRRKFVHPVSEFYVIYTGGNAEARPEELYLKDVMPGLDMKIKVIVGNKETAKAKETDGGKLDIINQYILFTKGINRIVRMKKEERIVALDEFVERSISTGILSDFLSKKKDEVKAMLADVMSQREQVRGTILAEKIATRKERQKARFFARKANALEKENVSLSKENEELKRQLALFMSKQS